jgi:hypothetical protein
MGDVIIATNAFLAVGTGTSSADRNVSGRLRSLAWTETFDEHDVTVMGSTTRIRAIGLGEADVQAEFMQSYSTADAEENIDSLVNNLITVSQGGGKFLIRHRPYNAARGATNPEYSMLSVLSERTIIDAEVGDPVMNPVTFLSAGPVTRVASTT